VLGQAFHERDDPYWDWDRWTRLPAGGQRAYWPRGQDDWELGPEWLEATRGTGAAAAAMTVRFAGDWHLSNVVPTAIRDLFPHGGRPHCLTPGSFDVDFPLSGDLDALEAMATAVFDVVDELQRRERRRGRPRPDGPRIRCGLLDDERSYAAGRALVTSPALLEDVPVVVLRASQLGNDSRFWSGAGLRERVLPSCLRAIAPFRPQTLAIVEAHNDFVERFDRWDWGDVCRHVLDSFCEHLPEAGNRRAELARQPSLRIAAVLPVDAPQARTRLGAFVAELNEDAIHGLNFEGPSPLLLEPGELRVRCTLIPLAPGDDPATLLVACPPTDSSTASLTAREGFTHESPDRG